jgi:hypothetical protein
MADKLAGESALLKGVRRAATAAKHGYQTRLLVLALSRMPSRSWQVGGRGNDSCGHFDHSPSSAAFAPTQLPPRNRSLSRR